MPKDVAQCRLIQLPRVPDPRGNLTFVESMRHVPFEVRRIFYIYNIPENGARGGHAHKLLHQFIIPIAGRFDVIVNDGVDKKEFHLSAPDVGLHVPPMFWVDMVRFAAGSLPLVLASDWYDEADYYRDFDAFRAAAVQCA